MTAPRLTRFFEHRNGHYVVRKSLRDAVMFAPQDLVRDTPFSRLDLVLCRNVLIYFNKKLQDRALGLFHDSLSRRGFMGLGSKESIAFSACSAHFEVLDKPARIFRKL